MREVGEVPRMQKPWNFEMTLRSYKSQKGDDEMACAQPFQHKITIGGLVSKN
jgi:hypothetical protein